MESEYEEDNEMNVYLTGEDPRYQTLVLQGSFGARGWSVDRYTGELTRVCICCAYESGECCCGAWDDAEDYQDE